MLDYFTSYSQRHRPFHIYIAITSVAAVWLLLIFMILALLEINPLDFFTAFINTWEYDVNWNQVFIISPSLMLCGFAYMVAWRSGFWHFSIPAMYGLALLFLQDLSSYFVRDSLGLHFFLSLPWAILGAGALALLLIFLWRILSVPLALSSLLLAFGVQSWLERAEVFIYKAVPTYSFISYAAVFVSLILGLLLWWFYRHVLGGNRMKLAVLNMQLPRFLGISSNFALWLSLLGGAILAALGAVFLWWQYPSGNIVGLNLSTNIAWVALLVVVLANGNPLGVMFCALFFVMISVSLHSSHFVQFNLPVYFDYFLQTLLLFVYLMVDGFLRYSVVFKKVGDNNV